MGGSGRPPCPPTLRARSESGPSASALSNGRPQWRTTGLPPPSGLARCLREDGADLRAKARVTAMRARGTALLVLADGHRDGDFAIAALAEILVERHGSLPLDVERSSRRRLPPTPPILPPSATTTSTVTRLTTAPTASPRATAPCAATGRRRD